MGESDQPEGRPGPELSAGRLCEAADANGIGRGFRQLLDAALRHGLYPRLYKTSIMYAPPMDKRRVLFTVWTKPRNGNQVIVWVGPTAFAKFYPISEENAIRIMGPDGWRVFSTEDIDDFIVGLDDLFQVVDDDRKMGDKM